MCLGGGGSSSLNEEYEQQRAEEAARQARIKSGMEEINNAFAGYDDDFYAQRQADYLNYATPEIEDQYVDAMKDLTRALARSGNLNSSLAAQRRADLLEKKSKAEATAARKGQGYVNDTRSALANVKSNLIQQNNALADPTLIAAMAANQSQAASALPEFSPIGQLFAGATQGLATQQQLEARNKNRYEMAELFNMCDRSRVVH
jgi:hypothetical protein